MVQIGDKSEVSEDNCIPTDENKLKEDQQKEYLELVEKFKRECLKSYNINRSGEVIKKFNLPSFQPLTEAQRESKMIDIVVFIDFRMITKFHHVETFCPTGRAKRCVDAKINTLESEGKCSPSMESEPRVPVNLI